MSHGVDVIHRARSAATSQSPQPPDVDRRTETHYNRPNPPIARLPDEILDLILQKHIPHPHALRKRTRRFYTDLISCSLVCQRWRRIVLPYIFDRVHFVGWYSNLYTSDVLEEDYCDEEEVFTFLTKTKTIAPLFRELFCENSVLSILTISCLLTLLPKLKSLRLRNTALLGYDRCKESDRGEGFRINVVEYSPSDEFTESISDYKVTLLEFLGLFSEVGTLCLDAGDHLSDHIALEDYSESSDKDGPNDHRLRVEQACERIQEQEQVVHAIRLSNSEWFPIYRDVLCTSPHILRHVTSLELTKVRFSENEYYAITALLSLVGPKIRELSLRFEWSWRDPWLREGGILTMISDNREQIFGLLKSQLVECTSLRTFQLSMTTSILLPRNRSVEEAVATQFAIDNWLFLVRMLGTIRSETLRYISVRFWQSVRLKAGNHTYDMWNCDLRRFPWSALQEVCRHHGNLESIAISFAEDAHNDGDHVGLQCIREQMQEFKEPIAMGESGTFDTCRERIFPLVVAL